VSNVVPLNAVMASAGGDFWLRQILLSRFLQGRGMEKILKYGAVQVLPRRKIV